MGYDMYIVGAIPGEGEAYQAAKDQFKAAVAERDKYERGSDEANEAQKKVEAAYALMDDAHKSYFRLNIWGMSRMRDSMAELGMLAWHYDDQPWPEQPEIEGFDWDSVWDLEDDERLNHSNPEVRAYFEAQEQHKRWSPPDEPGLPVHKFGSNDGWVITPQDIHGALQILETQQKTNPDLVAKVRAEWNYEDSDGNTFDEWIEYLKLAEKYDGFTVW